MKMKWFYIFLFCLSVIGSYAQDPEIKRECVFTGSGLYGYMNGGAELFLEYGVSKLTARDLLYGGEEYSLEIYEMPTPEDAFGIYSMHVFRCARADSSGCIDCLSPYQLQAVKGNKYVSLVFASGSEKARRQADEVIRCFFPSGDDVKPEIPEAFASLSPLSGKLKFLRGKIGLSGVCMPLVTVLDGVPYTGIWLLKEDGHYRAAVSLENPEQAEVLRQRVPAGQIRDLGGGLWEFSGEEEESAPSGDFGF